VVAYDHRIAIDLLGAAYRLNLKIPRDFSMICFNDEFPVAQVSPPFTVVAVSVHDMGREAARLLMRVINREQPKSRKQERVRVPEKLVIREIAAAVKGGA
jgi:LacI family transcriptional regulator